MSDTDSFIDEVNEEVRRDRLYGLLRRYGWIPALAVVAIVGAASWLEYSKAQDRAAAESVGDALLTALSENSPEDRLDGLMEAPTGEAGAAAVAGFLRAGQAEEVGDTRVALAELDAISVNPDIALVYRHIAAFKAMTLQADTLPVEELRQGFEALAVAGAPLRLLAAEQLALLEVREGNSDAAITRYQAILVDAAVSPDLQQRALQVIVALGGTPELDAMGALGN